MTANNQGAGHRRGGRSRSRHSALGDDTRTDWTELLVIVMLVVLLTAPFAADAASVVSPLPATSGSPAETCQGH